MSSPMAGWILNNNQKLNSKISEGNEMVTMGSLFSHKYSSGDFMQNCDLPPPLKVFTGSDTTVVKSMNRICSMMGKEEEDDGDELEKLKLLKALRLSQTRAREAERKNEVVCRERDCISNALLEESLRLFAHRQWVKLLEIQVLKLQSQSEKDQIKEKENSCCRYCSRSIGIGGEGEEDGVKWILALTLCLGIAGVGFAFGCRYLF